jgi:hypothetical protein
MRPDSLIRTRDREYSEAEVDGWPMWPWIVGAIIVSLVLIFG